MENSINGIPVQKLYILNLKVINEINDDVDDIRVGIYTDEDLMIETKRIIELKIKNGDYELLEGITFINLWTEETLTNTTEFNLFLGNNEN
jgi:hypothetical protein